MDAPAYKGKLRHMIIFYILILSIFFGKGVFKVLYLNQTEEAERLYNELPLRCSHHIFSVSAWVRDTMMISEKEMHSNCLQLLVHLGDIPYQHFLPYMFLSNIAYLDIFRPSIAAFYQITTCAFDILTVLSPFTFVAPTLCV